MKKSTIIKLCVLSILFIAFALLDWQRTNRIRQEHDLVNELFGWALNFEQVDNIRIDISSTYELSFASDHYNFCAARAMLNPFSRLSFNENTGTYGGAFSGYQAFDFSNVEEVARIVYTSSDMGVLEAVIYVLPNDFRFQVSHRIFLFEGRPAIVVFDERGWWLGAFAGHVFDLEAIFDMAN